MEGCKPWLPQWKRCLNVYGTKGGSDGDRPLPCAHYTSELE
jgi:hypothetical protein